MDGCGGRIVGPPRSPDLNPLHFFCGDMSRRLHIPSKSLSKELCIAQGGGHTDCTLITLLLK